MGEVVVGVEEVVEVLEVEDRTAEDRMVEVRVVPEEAGDKVEVKEEEETMVKGEQGVIQGTRPKDMLTSLPLKPVIAIGPSGSQLISVWSQGPARGKMCGYPSPTNETGTSPNLVTNLTTNSSKLCCTTENKK